MPIKTTAQWVAAIMVLGMGQAAVGDAAYNPATQAAQLQWTERYEYDSLGRLRKVTFANGAVTNYTIDKAGNRTAVNTTTP